MSSLSILAAVTGAPDDEAAIAIAADLARRHGSVATVVTFAPTPVAAMAPSFGGAALATEVVADFEERQQAIRDKVSVLVTQQAAKFGLSTMADGTPALIDAVARDSGWATIMCELPLVDLAVVAQSSVEFEGSWSGPLGEVLMEGRSPVFVARGAMTAAGRPAAIAWDGSLEAGRAVRAALPLLRDASEVAILQDPDGLDTSPRSQADPDRLIAYLGSRGVRAEKVVNVRGRKIGPTLLQAAIDFDASLLVAGAYHHSRLAEAIFGGATHTFLSQGDGPHLLIAH